MLISTDEMRFYQHNVDQAKFILEDRPTIVNVKNQNERLMRRTLCLSTSNEETWKIILNEKKPIRAREDALLQRKTIDGQPQVLG